MYAHVSGYSRAIKKRFEPFWRGILIFLVKESQVLQNTEVYEESLHTKALLLLQYHTILILLLYYPRTLWLT